jgi:hypothetical protein
MFICPKKIMMALLFMVLAAPVAFQTVRGVLGGWIATVEGLPKIGGLAVHALVFMVLSTLIWRLPFGSSMFEGDEEYRRLSKEGVARNKARAAARARAAASQFEDEEAGAGPAVVDMLPGF